MIKEFKAFLLRGNILELAVAFIMGVAFTTVVKAFTDGIVQPIIGAIIGKPSFNTVWHLGDGAIQIGTFITAVINFVLVAAVAFLIVKLATRAIAAGKKEEPATAELQSDEVILLTEIRDSLRSSR